MNEGLLSQGLSGISDGELTTLVRQGPRRDSFLAVAELFSRHWAGVYRYAGLCTRRPAAAIELAKEAFLLVQRELRDSESHARPFAWRPRLLATVLACARTWSTSERRADLNSELLAWLGEVGNAREAEEGGPPALARWALSELPEQSQCLLWHSVVEGDPPDVVSRLTGQGEQVAARQLARVRRLFREECVQAHLTRTIDRECLAYGSLIDAATRSETAGSGPLDLEQHLAGCAHCRVAAEELEQHGGRLTLVLAGGLLSWGAKPYLESRTVDAVHSAPPPRRSAYRLESRTSVLAVVAGLAAGALVAVAATVGSLVAPAHGNTASEAGSSSAYSQPKPTDSASAASPLPGTQLARTQLRNAKTGQCLDVSGGTPAAGADVVSARCSSSNSQLWVFDTDSLVHTSADPNLCLDTTSDGSVVLHTCGQESGPGAHGLRLSWNKEGEISTSTPPDLALTPASADGQDDVVLKPRDGSRAQIWLGLSATSGSLLPKRAAPAPSGTQTVRVSSPPPTSAAPSPSWRPPAPSPTPLPSLKVSFGAKEVGEIFNEWPYTVTATGFAPNHDIHLTWGTGTDGCNSTLLDVLKTDSTGSAVYSGGLLVAPGLVTFCADDPNGSRSAKVWHVLS